MLPSKRTRPHGLMQGSGPRVGDNVLPLLAAAALVLLVLLFGTSFLWISRNGLLASVTDLKKKLETQQHIAANYKQQSQTKGSELETERWRTKTLREEKEKEVEKANSKIHSLEQTVQHLEVLVQGKHEQFGDLKMTHEATHGQMTVDLRECKEELDHVKYETDLLRHWAEEEEEHAHYWRELYEQEAKGHEHTASQLADATEESHTWRNIVQGLEAHPHAHMPSPSSVHSAPDHHWDAGHDHGAGARAEHAADEGRAGDDVARMLQAKADAAKAAADAAAAAAEHARKAAQAVHAQGAAHSFDAHPHEYHVEERFTHGK